MPLKIAVQKTENTICTGSKPGYLILFWNLVGAENSNTVTRRRNLIMGITNNPAFSASQNNLFGFRPPSVKLAAKHPDQTRKDLAILGLSVCQCESKHWMVTHRATLPELHFYSEWELTQFANHKAHQYANQPLTENT
jgi:hypothetical protein